MDLATKRAASWAASGEAQPGLPGKLGKEEAENEESLRARFILRDRLRELVVNRRLLKFVLTVSNI